MDQRRMSSPNLSGECAGASCGANCGAKTRPLWWAVAAITSLWVLTVLLQQQEQEQDRAPDDGTWQTAASSPAPAAVNRRAAADQQRAPAAATPVSSRPATIEEPSPAVSSIDSTPSIALPPDIRKQITDLAAAHPHPETLMPLLGDILLHAYARTKNTLTLRHPEQTDISDHDLISELRERFEQELPPRTRRLLPGRPAPHEAWPADISDVSWGSERFDATYHTHLRPLGTAADGTTRIQVETTDADGNLLVRYQGRGYIARDGTLHVDGRQAEITGPMSNRWSPDSFRIDREGRLTTIDDLWQVDAGVAAPLGSH